MSCARPSSLSRTNSALRSSSAISVIRSFAALNSASSRSIATSLSAAEHPTPSGAPLCAQGYLPQVKGSRKERSTVREDQSLAEMGNEVLMCQAKVRADQSGEPIGEAMEAVVNTEAGKQLRD